MTVNGVSLKKGFKMDKWVVEYKVTDKRGWQSMEHIEAVDGKEAIEYVKKHIWGCYKFKAWREEEVGI